MGQGHSIVESCRNANLSLTSDACNISFASFTSSSRHNTSDFNISLYSTSTCENEPPFNVTKFGSIEKGGFQGDPDIAGTGVFIAFITLSVIVSSFGLILAAVRGFSLLSSWTDRWPVFANAAKWPEKVHNYVDGLVLASADTQLLLILAFGLSFYTTSKCSISLYHYFVAHHIVLLGLITSVQAFVVVRSPLKLLVTSIARITVMVICLAGLFATKGFTASLRLKYADRDIKFQDRIPSVEQQDSLLLLPAYCILDKSLNPVANLTKCQIEKLENEGMQRGSVAQNYIALILVVLLFLVLFLATIRKWCLREKQVREEQRDWSFWIKMGIKCSAWITCLILTIFNWVIIVQLRFWMNQNEWLDDKPFNPENSVRGFGQYAPLASLGVVLVTLLDGLSDVLLRKLPWLYRGDDNREEKDDGSR